MSNEETIDTNKRNFLKKGAIGAGILGLGAIGLVTLDHNNLLPSSDSDIRNINPTNEAVPDDPNKHWGFMIDLAKCDGCEGREPPEDDPTGERPRCSYACRKMHHFLDADPPMYWIRVYKLEQTEGVDSFHFPKPCQNCQDAPCKRVCPTGATYQRDDGTVLINHKICIGCRICMAACPYETRFFWYNDPPKLSKEDSDVKYHPEFPVPFEHGTVIKCDYCLDQAYNGRLPHCVNACPTGALYYGDMNEDVVTSKFETVGLHAQINDRSGYRYKEDEGTRPSVYYLPVLKNQMNSNRTTRIMIINETNNGEGKWVQFKVEDASGGAVKNHEVVVEKIGTFGSAEIETLMTDGSGYGKVRIPYTTISGGNRTVNNQYRIRLNPTDKLIASEVIVHGN
jgi:molybdopterin-containing oxidoreductase family iron-sulfur binding subunit